MRYYRKQDEGWHPEWGEDPVYYVEVNAEGNAVRQLDLYPDGHVLRYDERHREDEHGSLGVMVVDGDEDWWEKHAITPDEFEEAWRRATPSVGLQDEPSDSRP